MFKPGWLTGKGRSPEKAEYLSRDHIPSFMEIVGHYKVVIGPTYESPRLTGDHWYVYGVRDKYSGGPVFFFRAPWNNLPKEFWVRKIIAAYSYYEFIPTGDKSALEQRYPTVSDETCLSDRAAPPTVIPSV